MALTAQTDSRIADANRTWQQECNVDVTGWNKANEFIISTWALSDSVNPDSYCKLQWRRAGGTFADVAADTEICWGTDTVLTDDLAFTVDLSAGCFANWDVGEENEGDNSCYLLNVANGDYGECQWALGFGSGALDDQEYEIQFVVIDFASSAACQASITTAVGGQEYDETGKLVTLLSVLDNSDAYTMAETEKLISAAVILDSSDVCAMAEAGKSLTLLSVLEGSDIVTHAESGKELTALADVVGSDGLLYLEIGKLLTALSGVSGGDALTVGETGMQTLLLVAISKSDLQQMVEDATMVALAEVTGDDEYFPFYSGECADWGGHGWGWRQA